MIIEKDTKMLIHSTTRGKFYAKARRTFSLDDDMYPVIITDPLESHAVRNQEADLRAEMSKIELLEMELETDPESEPVVDCDVVTQPMAVEIEPEEEMRPFVGIKMDSGK